MRFAGGLVLCLLVGCRTPTQITVELSTTVPCSSSPITTLQVGSPADVDNRDPVLRTADCHASGHIGTITIVPSGADDASFALKVLLAHGGRTIEDCRLAELESGSLSHCIISKRELKFQPHSELSVPIELQDSPLGICQDGGCADGPDGDAEPGDHDLDDAGGDQDLDAAREADAETSDGDAALCPDGACEVHPDAGTPGPCGDGVMNAGEACDDGFRDDCGACNRDCSGPGDGRPHAACECAPQPDAGTDGGVVSVGEDFSANMLGCPGHVAYAMRASLCGAGYSPCTVDQWIARRAAKVPHHHYWTNDDFKIVDESPDGVHSGCYYSKTYGRPCTQPTHVCADVDVDPEGNDCVQPYGIRNCGRLDPTPPPNEYFGGLGGTVPSESFTAGTLCCCAASGVACAASSPIDTFSDGMFGCAGSVGWQERASLCAAGCTVCTSDQWLAKRQGKAPTRNYWTNDNLKYSGAESDMCYVSKVYGLDSSPYPMRVCSDYLDANENGCGVIHCGAADIAPPPNEYLGGCNTPSGGTLCCKP
jgi:hypothetical protein